MPPKTAKKRAYKKKAPFKKKAYSKSTVAAPMTKGPFKMYDDKDPIMPRKVCKLTYSDVIGLTSGVGGIIGTQKLYNLNSLFDPDQSGVGHQPYYYDQMTAMYQRYKVNGCLVELTFSNPTIDGVDLIMMVQPSSSTISTLTGGNTPDYLERPQSVVRELNNSGSQKVHIKQYFDIARIEGLSKLQFSSANSDVYCANYNANPGATVTLALAAGCYTQGISGAAVNCFVKLTYYAVLYERIQPGQS